MTDEHDLRCCRASCTCWWARGPIRNDLRLRGPVCVQDLSNFNHPTISSLFHVCPQKEGPPVTFLETFLWLSSRPCLHSSRSHFLCLGCESGTSTDSVSARCKAFATNFRGLVRGCIEADFANQFSFWACEKYNKLIPLHVTLSYNNESRQRRLDCLLNNELFRFVADI